MENVLIVIVVFVGVIVMTYLVTKKNVKKHRTEFTIGNVIQFKTETEFNKEK